LCFPALPLRDKATGQPVKGEFVPFHHPILRTSLAAEAWPAVAADAARARQISP